MIFYMRTDGDRDIKSVIQKLQETGLKATVKIYDDEKDRKADSSAYRKMQERLIKEKHDLCVDSLLSLGRTDREIYKELTWLDHNNITLYVLDLPFTYQKEGQSMDALLDIYTFLANKEQKKLKEKQRIGIDAARKEHRSYGRKRIDYPENWALYYAKWQSGSITAKEFMNAVNLKKGTFYHLVKRYNAGDEEGSIPKEA